MTPAELLVTHRIFQSPLGYFKEDQPRLSEQLALQKDWSPAYAKRVILEYQRFVFLAMHADRPLVSSEQVDEVLQFDLAHRVTFWAKVCADVSAAWSTFGKSDSYDFSTWDDPYKATLDAYQARWGHAPPEDIWAEPSARQLSEFPIPRVAKQSPWSRVVEWVFFLAIFGFLVKMVEFTAKSDSPWFGVPFFILMIVLVIKSFFFSDQCKRCKRYNTISRTNVVVEFPPTLEKLIQRRCNHCGKVSWVISDIRRDCAGGGGGG